MDDTRIRMIGLHHLLTGGAVRTGAYSYPPRHLWGDIGQPEAKPGRRARWWRAGR